MMLKPLDHQFLLSTPRTNKFETLKKPGAAATGLARQSPEQLKGASKETNMSLLETRALLHREGASVKAIRLLQNNTCRMCSQWVRAVGAGPSPPSPFPNLFTAQLFFLLILLVLLILLLIVLLVLLVLLLLLICLPLHLNFQVVVIQTSSCLHPSLPPLAPRPRSPSPEIPFSWLCIPRVPRMPGSCFGTTNIAKELSATDTGRSKRRNAAGRARALHKLQAASLHDKPVTLSEGSLDGPFDFRGNWADR